MRSARQLPKNCLSHVDLGMLLKTEAMDIQYVSTLKKCSGTLSIYHAFLPFSAIWNGVSMKSPMEIRA